jgi:hypothetical protein
VLNLWKLFVECSLNAVIIVYRRVKFTSGYIASEREDLLYVMRIDQEGRQHQGLRTVFKPLKEWYGKTDESQLTTLRRLPCVWPMKEALRGRRFSSDE